MLDHQTILKPFRDMYQQLDTGKPQEIFRAYAAYLKEIAPEITRISFDWVDGSWIWINAPSADPERDISQEPIQECLPDADDTLGFWLMELAGGDWCDREFSVEFDSDGEIRAEEAA